MTKKNILIGCEYSATVRSAFEVDNRFNVYSNDILDSEIPGKHLKMDINDAIDYFKWDLIILHLPCTKIALCGNSTYGNGMIKHNERIEAIEWTKKTYFHALSVCDKVVLENPKNVMGKYIGKHSQKIQPYEFGHYEQKETWLWINNLPLLKPTNNVYKEMLFLPEHVKQRIHYMSPSPLRGLERSRFFPGIAEAFYLQWKEFI